MRERGPAREPKTMNSVGRHHSFNSPALYAALDARRRARGLSWQRAAGEIGVAASTLRRTETAGPMETDGILAMIRWLGCVPEEFIRGVDAELLKTAQPAMGRFDSHALHQALEAHRRARGITWRELAAETGIGPAGMLTRLEKGGRIGVNVMVAAVGYLSRTVASFTRDPRRNRP